MKNRKVILSMQMTLDGYIAGPNDEMDWVSTSDAEWDSMFTELTNVDTYLLGRKMYPGYSVYWRSLIDQPNPSNERKFARLADKTQHIVFSRGDFKPDWSNTRVAHDPSTEISRLREQDGKNIIVWGGGSFAKSLIDLGLIDEYRIVLNPTLLGSGKPLFKESKQRKALKLLEAQPLKSGLVLLRYGTH